MHSIRFACFAGFINLIEIYWITKQINELLVTPINYKRFSRAKQLWIGYRMSKIELQHWGISFYNSLDRILSGLQEGEKWMARRIPRQFFWLWQWQAGDSLPALLTPFERQQHFSLATGLPQFPAICGLYKHSSTRVQRVALDWLRNNIQYYILLQSFFTINNNSIYILNLITIHIPCIRHTWSHLLLCNNVKLLLCAVRNEFRNWNNLQPCWLIVTAINTRKLSVCLVSSGLKIIDKLGLWT